MFHVQLVYLIFKLHDLFCLDLDVCGLTLWEKISEKTSQIGGEDGTKKQKIHMRKNSSTSVVDNFDLYERYLDKVHLT